ncbi:MAG TPA: Rrf2 family transcriptional regulator [Steroidobacteraceae bacterium]|nr:Rrf2 family transcriptional regulator [Steroidobacteraceae bacterium]
MRLTLYTDYTLRVMMYLAVKSRDGATTTIDEIADAYAISRSNLTKIVNELAQNGFIETIRGRAGGMRLARPPGEISVGTLVRLAEKDFGIVACHSVAADVNCAILPTCNLRNGLKRAVDAFLRELDKMTLADAIISPSVAASLLQIGPVGGKEIAVSVASLVGRRRAAGKSKGHAVQAARKPRRSRMSKAI